MGTRGGRGCYHGRGASRPELCLKGRMYPLSNHSLAGREPLCFFLYSHFLPQPLTGWAQWKAERQGKPSGVQSRVEKGRVNLEGHTEIILLLAHLWIHPWRAASEDMLWQLLGHWVIGQQLYLGQLPLYIQHLSLDLVTYQLSLSLLEKACINLLGIQGKSQHICRGLVSPHLNVCVVYKFLTLSGLGVLSSLCIYTWALWYLCPSDSPSSDKRFEGSAFFGSH